MQLATLREAIMIHSRSLEAVAATRQAPHLGRPLYDSYGFAQIPSLIRSFWGGPESFLRRELTPTLPQEPEVVVWMILDGFGWSFFERFAELPFLRRVEQDGVIAKLTTQFPSTTAAHITTFHTGQPVAQSGVWEWFYYEPMLDDIFAPLLFQTLGRETSSPVDVGQAEALYPRNTLYQELAERGITTTCHQRGRYATSPFSLQATAGAARRPFKTLPQGVVNLREALTEPGPAYHAVYFDPIDSTSHQYGPDSPHLAAEIRSLFTLLEAELGGAAWPRGRTLFVITADHGHIQVRPEETVYLDEEVPEVMRWVRYNQAGTPMVAGGSPRDMFMYVEPAHLEEAEHVLTKALEGRAGVFQVSDLLRDGYFGPSPSERLRERLGNLLILPYPHEMVWWRGVNGRFSMHHRGHHGGLSAAEMEIPLLLWMP